jgi:cytochrome b
MRVWDGATRLFHWALLVVIVVSYVSISLADGPNALLWMQIHVISGETALALLVFRLLWGIYGSDTSRFSRFLRNPLAALHHLREFPRREPDRQIGHNAAGGWMVVILLLLLAVQIGTGLCANDDGSTEGPLVRFISRDASDQLSKLHGINFNILLGAIILHVVAVLAYAVIKRHDLVRPMITGKKRLPAATPAPRMAPTFLAAATFALAAIVAVVVGRL